MADSEYDYEDEFPDEESVLAAEHSRTPSFTGLLNRPNSRPNSADVTTTTTSVFRLPPPPIQSLPLDITPAIQEETPSAALSTREPAEEDQIEDETEPTDIVEPEPILFLNHDVTLPTSSKDLDELISDVAEEEFKFDVTPIENYAATRIQALQRGRTTRKKLAQMNHSTVEEEGSDQMDDEYQNETFTTTSPDEILAATRIQALQRGRVARKKLAQLNHNGTVEEESDQTNDPYQNETFITTSLDENLAATRIQALQRGRVVRQKLAASNNASTPSLIEESPQTVASVSPTTAIIPPSDETMAAIRIQSVYRGSAVRSKQKRAMALSDSSAVLHPSKSQQLTEEQAAIKIQSIARGRLVRKSTPHFKQQAQTRIIPVAPTLPPIEETRAQHAAATKIQAVHRGRVVRKKHGALTKLPSQPPSSSKEEHEAAVKIQALHRGRLARKQVRQLKPLPTTTIPSASTAASIVDPVITEPEPTSTLGAPPIRDEPIPPASTESEPCEDESAIIQAVMPIILRSLDLREKLARPEQKLTHIDLTIPIATQLLNLFPPCHSVATLLSLCHHDELRPHVWSLLLLLCRARISADEEADEPEHSSGQNSARSSRSTRSTRSTRSGQPLPHSLIFDHEVDELTVLRTRLLRAQCDFFLGRKTLTRFGILLSNSESTGPALDVLVSICSLVADLQQSINQAKTGDQLPATHDSDILQLKEAQQGLTDLVPFLLNLIDDLTLDANDKLEKKRTEVNDVDSSSLTTTPRHPSIRIQQLEQLFYLLSTIIGSDTTVTNPILSESLPVLFDRLHTFFAVEEPTPRLLAEAVTLLAHFAASVTTNTRDAVIRILLEPSIMRVVVEWVLGDPLYRWNLQFEPSLLFNASQAFSQLEVYVQTQLLIVLELVCTASSHADILNSHLLPSLLYRLLRISAATATNEEDHRVVDEDLASSQSTVRILALNCLSSLAQIEGVNLLDDNDCPISESHTPLTTPAALFRYLSDMLSANFMTYQRITERLTPLQSTALPLPPTRVLSWIISAEQRTSRQSLSAHKQVLEQELGAIFIALQQVLTKFMPTSAISSTSEHLFGDLAAAQTNLVEFIHGICAPLSTAPLPSSSPSSSPKHLAGAATSTLPPFNPTLSSRGSITVSNYMTSTQDTIPFVHIQIQALELLNRLASFIPPDASKEETHGISDVLLNIFSSSTVIEALLPLLKLKFLKLNSETMNLRVVQLRMRRSVIKLLRRLTTHQQWLEAVFGETTAIKAQPITAASTGDDTPAEPMSITIEPFTAIKEDYDEDSFEANTDRLPSNLPSLSTATPKLDLSPILIKHLMDIFENELTAYLKEQQANESANPIEFTQPLSEDDDHPKQGYKYLFRELSHLLQHLLHYQSQLDEADISATRSSSLLSSLKHLLPPLLCLLQSATDCKLLKTTLSNVCLYTRVGHGRGTELLTQLYNITGTSASQSQQVYPLVIFMQAWGKVSDDSLLQLQLAETFSKVLLRASLNLQLDALRPISPQPTTFVPQSVNSNMGITSPIHALTTGVSSSVTFMLSASSTHGSDHIPNDRRELLNKYLNLVGGQDQFESGLKAMLLQGHAQITFHVLYIWSLFLQASTQLSGLATSDTTEEPNVDYPLVRLGGESSSLVLNLDRTLFPHPWSYSIEGLRSSSEVGPSSYLLPHIFRIAFHADDQSVDEVDFRTLSLEAWTVLCNLSAFPSNHAVILHWMEEDFEVEPYEDEAPTSKGNYWSRFSSFICAHDEIPFRELFALFLANLCAIPDTTEAVAEHFDFNGLKYLLDTSAPTTTEASITISILNMLIHVSELSAEECMKWLQIDGLWSSLMKLKPIESAATPSPKLDESTGKINWILEQPQIVPIDKRITELVTKLLVQVTEYINHDDCRDQIDSNLGPLNEYLCGRIQFHQKLEATDPKDAIIVGNISRTLVNLLCTPLQEGVDEAYTGPQVNEVILTRWCEFFECPLAEQTICSLLQSKQSHTTLKAILLVNHFTGLDHFVPELVQPFWDDANIILMIDAILFLSTATSLPKSSPVGMTPPIQTSASIIPMATLLNNILQAYARQVSELKSTKKSKFTAPKYVEKLFSPPIIQLLLTWSVRTEDTTLTSLRRSEDIQSETNFGTVYPGALQPPSIDSSEVFLAAWISILALSAMTVVCSQHDRLDVLLLDQSIREQLSQTFSTLLTRMDRSTARSSVKFGGNLSVAPSASPSRAPSAPSTPRLTFHGSRLTSRWMLVLTCMHFMESQTASIAPDGNLILEVDESHHRRVGLNQFRTTFGDGGGLRLLLNFVTRAVNLNDFDDSQAMIHPSLISQLSIKLLAAWSHLPHILEHLQQQCPEAFELDFEQEESAETNNTPNESNSSDDQPIRIIVVRSSASTSHAPPALVHLRELIFAHRMQFTMQYLTTLAAEDASFTADQKHLVSFSEFKVQHEMHSHVMNFCRQLLQMDMVNEKDKVMQSLLIMKLASCNALKLQYQRRQHHVELEHRAHSNQPHTHAPPPLTLTPLPDIDARSLVFQLCKERTIPLLLKLSAVPATHPFLILSFRALFNGSFLAHHWQEFVVVPPKLVKPNRKMSTVANANQQQAPLASIHHLYALLLSMFEHSDSLISEHICPLLQLTQLITSRVIEGGLRFEEAPIPPVVIKKGVPSGVTRQPLSPTIGQEQHTMLLTKLVNLFKELTEPTPDFTPASTEIGLIQENQLCICHILVNLSSLPTFHPSFIQANWLGTLIKILDNETKVSTSNSQSYLHPGHIEQMLQVMSNLLRDADILTVVGMTKKGSGLGIDQVKKSFYHYLSFLCKKVPNSKDAPNSSSNESTSNIPSDESSLASSSVSDGTKTMTTPNSPTPKFSIRVTSRVLRRMESSHNSWKNDLELDVLRHDATARLRAIREAEYPSYVKTHNHVGVNEAANDKEFKKLMKGLEKHQRKASKASHMEESDEVVEEEEDATNAPQTSEPAETEEAEPVVNEVYLLTTRNSEPTPDELVTLQRLILQLLLLCEGNLTQTNTPGANGPSTKNPLRRAIDSIRATQGPKKLIAQSLLDCHTISLLLTSLHRLSAQDLPLLVTGVILKIVSNPSFEFVAFGGEQTSLQPLSLLYLTHAHQFACDQLNPSLSRHGFLLLTSFLFTTPPGSLAHLAPKLRDDLLTFLCQALTDQESVHSQSEDDIVLILRSLDCLFEQIPGSVDQCFKADLLDTLFFPLVEFGMDRLSQQAVVPETQLLLITQLMHRFVEPIEAHLKKNGILNEFSLESPEPIQDRNSIQFSSTQLIDQILPSYCWLISCWSRQVELLQQEYDSPEVKLSPFADRWLDEISYAKAVQRCCMNYILTIFAALRLTTKNGMIGGETHECQPVLSIMNELVHQAWNLRHTPQVPTVYQVLLSFLYLTPPAKSNEATNQPSDQVAPLADVLQSTMLHYFTMLSISNQESVQRLTRLNFYDLVLYDYWWSTTITSMPISLDLLKLMRTIVEHGIARAKQRKSSHRSSLTRTAGGISISDAANIPAFLFTENLLQTLLLIAHSPTLYETWWRTEALEVLKLLSTIIIPDRSLHRPSVHPHHHNSHHTHHENETKENPSNEAIQNEGGHAPFSTELIFELLKCWLVQIPIEIPMPKKSTSSATTEPPINTKPVLFTPTNSLHDLTQFLQLLKQLCTDTSPTRTTESSSTSNKQSTIFFLMSQRIEHLLLDLWESGLKLPAYGPEAEEMMNGLSKSIFNLLLFLSQHSTAFQESLVNKASTNPSTAAKPDPVKAKQVARSKTFNPYSLLPSNIHVLNPDFVEKSLQEQQRQQQEQEAENEREEANSTGSAAFHSLSFIESVLLFLRSTISPPSLTFFESFSKELCTTICGIPFIRTFMWKYGWAPVLHALLERACGLFRSNEKDENQLAEDETGHFIFVDQVSPNTRTLAHSFLQSTLVTYYYFLNDRSSYTAFLHALSTSIQESDDLQEKARKKQYHDSVGLHRDLDAGIDILPSLTPASDIGRKYGLEEYVKAMTILDQLISSQPSIIQQYAPNNDLDDLNTSESVDSPPTSPTSPSSKAVVFSSVGVSHLCQRLLADSARLLSQHNSNLALHRRAAETELLAHKKKMKFLPALFGMVVNGGVQLSSSILHKATGKTWK